MDDSSTATIELRPSQIQHPTGNAIFRLPDFWQSNPSGWFHSVEAQFALRAITDDTTMYNYVLSSLGNDSSAAIEGLLDNPPSTNKYNILKQELLKIYGLT